jgi:hypothetical protein
VTSVFAIVLPRAVHLRSRMDSAILHRNRNAWMAECPWGAQTNLSHCFSGFYVGIVAQLYALASSEARTASLVPKSYHFRASQATFRGVALGII